MIPREILKTIRQIKPRKNCIVTEMLAGLSFQPSPSMISLLLSATTAEAGGKDQRNAHPENL
jgi:hypothetical protein